MTTSPLSAERAGPGQPATVPDGATGLELLRSPAARLRDVRGRLATALGPLGWPVAVYCGSRLLLFLLAGVVAVIRHQPAGPELLLFDGQWYLRLAEHGYPGQALHAKSTLGFFPLYPLAIRAVAGLAGLPAARAALAISTVGGLVAAVLVQRLAAGWWGEAAGRRATVIFCLFPGAIVFSLAYSECLTIPLALGCLLALRSRQWWAAGLLAGIATASEPVALVLIVVCAVAAASEIRERGWQDPAARRSLLAPLLSPLGAGGFAVFLWVWTGTPFAAYLAQHYGWHQQAQPLAFLALPLAHHLFGHPRELVGHIFTWNIWNGVLGGIFQLFSIITLVRGRRDLSPGTLVLTIGIAALTLWSVMTPPNARIVLVAFPAVLVWGQRLAGRRLAVFIAAEVAVLLLMSALTYSGHMLP